MHINFHFFSNQAISSLKENILPLLSAQLNAQQKKILMIASIALGFLAALYSGIWPLLVLRQTF